MCSAIALSLQDVPQPPSGHSATVTATVPAIDHDIDDGYEDLTAEEIYEDEMKKAMEASLRKDNEPGPSAPPQTNPFLSERAKLEQERLQRQKRLRAESSSAGVDVEMPAAKRQQQHSLPSKAGPSTSRPIAGPSTAAKDVSDGMFWGGIFRPISNMYSVPRRDGKATFKFTDILGPVRLQLLLILLILTIVLIFHFPPRNPKLPLQFCPHTPSTSPGCMGSSIQASPLL